MFYKFRSQYGHLNGVNLDTTNVKRPRSNVLNEVCRPTKNCTSTNTHVRGVFPLGQGRQTLLRLNVHRDIAATG